MNEVAPTGDQTCGGMGPFTGRDVEDDGQLVLQFDPLGEVQPALHGCLIIGAVQPHDPGAAGIVGELVCDPVTGNPPGIGVGDGAVGHRAVQLVTVDRPGGG